MSPLLAFPIWQNVSRSPTGTALTTASDAFVLTTLATLFFILGCFLLWLWLAWRRNKRLEAYHQMLEELEIETSQADSQPLSRIAESSNEESEDKSAPWERPADWWKQ